MEEQQTEATKKTLAERKAREQDQLRQAPPPNRWQDVSRTPPGTSKAYGPPSIGPGRDQYDQSRNPDSSFGDWGQNQRGFLPKPTPGELWDNAVRRSSSSSTSQSYSDPSLPSKTPSAPGFAALSSRPPPPTVPSQGPSYGNRPARSMQQQGEGERKLSVDEIMAKPSWRRSE